MASQPHVEQVGHVLGVNLRRDRLSLEDQDCARAINLDLHTLPGVARPRLGSTPLYESLGDGVSRLARINGYLYALVGDSWYRDGVGLTGPLTRNNGQMVGMRPIDDPQTWAFLANTTIMLKDKGFGSPSFYAWGIFAPATPATLSAGGAGSLLGNYSLVYTYLRRNGTAVAAEGNPSPVSNMLGVTHQTINVTGLVDSPDTQITHKRLYRTVNTGATWFFETDVPQGTTTATLTFPDDGLGVEVEQDNNQPNLCGWATEFQNHIFLALDPANPHYLWYSKRFKPEAFPATQYLEIGYPGDPITALVRLVGLLGVFTRDTKYRVTGNAVSGFVAIEALSSRGTPAGQATLATDQGALFIARDGMFLTNFQSADVALSSAIEPLFYDETVNDYAPIDWAHPELMALSSYKQRYYFSYPQVGGSAAMAVFSRETQKWYHYSIAPTVMYNDEVNDRLLAGTASGDILILESHAVLTEYFQSTLWLAERGGPLPFVRKRYQYLKVDANAAGGSMVVNFAIDGQPRHSVTVTGNVRQRRLYRLPDRMIGHTWTATVTMSNQAQQAFYSLVVLNQPLEFA